MTNSIFELIDAGDRTALANATYFQAQVTAIDDETGRVYIQRIDDEDSLPDEEPYTVLETFQPRVGDWVMMANWGRSAVCMGALHRTGTPDRHPIGQDVDLIFGAADPNGAQTADAGSIYLQTGELNDPSSAIQIKTTDGGNRGWLPLRYAIRRRTRRDVIVYGGASLSTSFVNQGFASSPVLSATTFSNGDATSGMFMQLATSSVLNNVASLVAGANSGVRPEWSAFVSMGIRTPTTITSIRLWYGLWSGSPAATDLPTTSCAGFRFSTNTSDVNWMTYTNDGVGTGTLVDTGIPFNSSAGTDLAMLLDGSEVVFYINGKEVSRHTTNLPTSTAEHDYGIYCTTLSAAARNFRWGRITIECEP
jgi:hypothetical protein